MGGKIEGFRMANTAPSDGRSDAGPGIFPTARLVHGRG